MFTVRIAIALLLLKPIHSDRGTDEVATHIQLFNEEYLHMAWLLQSADWCHSTNQTRSTAKAKGFVDELFNVWMTNWKQWAKDTLRSNVRTTQLKELKMISSGVSLAHPFQARFISEMRSRIATIYSSEIITISSKNIPLQGEDEIAEYLSKLKSPFEMNVVWKSWRKQVGSKIQPMFHILMDIINTAAKENGYPDASVSWKAEMGLTDATSTALLLWAEVADFYKELHAYVRAKLKIAFGDSQIEGNVAIPVHLLGSLYGDKWDGIARFVLPYQTDSLPNVSSYLKSRKLDVPSLVSLAEQMYSSLGFPPLSSTFWTKSMFVKPSSNRTVDCHAAAFDFFLRDDYRVRICGSVDEQNFYRAVHELGHVNYYMSYKNQPMLYRTGPTSAFHEAIGETMVYAAYNSACWKKFGWIDKHSLSDRDLINMLMKQALSKIVFLPWALVIDLWRYKVFDGTISNKDYLKEWWNLRKKFQGVIPPDYESQFLFDPGTKYHIAVGTPFMRYFFGRFLEHQFLESLCRESKISDSVNMHTCCFLGSKAAGEKLRSLMSAGASEPWPDLLESMTGYRSISAKPLMDYYEPLYKWLVEYNRRHNVTVGWI